MRLPPAGLEPNASADGRERMHWCERIGELLLKKPAAIPHLVLCNRYDLPIVELKMPRRQGARREHVLCDLRPRRNAGAGPFSTQPSGPRFLRRISASLSRSVSRRIQALRSLLKIRPSSSRRLASHTVYTTRASRTAPYLLMSCFDCSRPIKVLMFCFCASIVAAASAVFASDSAPSKSPAADFRRAEAR